MNILALTYELAAGDRARNAAIAAALRLSKIEAGSASHPELHAAIDALPSLVEESPDSPALLAAEDALIQLYAEALELERRWRAENSEESCGGMAGLRALAAVIDIGEYLYDYDEDTLESTSMPSWLDDRDVAELTEILRVNGLRFDTDDAGWLVVALDYQQ